MKDSTDNKELDQYGVWVKKTSKEPNKEALTSSKNEDTLLPDFSFLDDASNNYAKDDSKNKNSDFETEETSLTPDELSNIAVSAGDNSSEKSETPTSGDEEISLDDFITGGFSDDSPITNEDTTKAESKDNKESAADGEISLDEFLDTPSADTAKSDSKSEDISVDDFLGSGSSAKPSSSDEVSLDDFLDTPSVEKSPKEDEIVDENPMDIDLSFDDTMSVQSENSSDNANKTETETPEISDQKGKDLNGTEEIDMSSFNEPASKNADASKSTEVSLDDFDSQFGNIVDENDSSKVQKSSSHEAKSDNSNTEDIDLSDFGIDESSEEKNVILPGTEPKEKVNDNVDYEMNVSTDDESSVGGIATETSSNSDQEENVNLETEPAANEEKTETNDEIISSIDVSAPADDFDVDEIMNSVKDEQGKTVCIGKTADAIAKDVETVSFEDNKKPTEEIKPELIEDLNDVSTLDESAVEKTIPISVENDSTPKQSEDNTDFNDIIEQPQDSKDILDYLPDNIASTISDVDKKEDADENTNAIFHTTEVAPENDVESIPKELDEKDIANSISIFEPVNAETPVENNDSPASLDENNTTAQETQDAEKESNSEIECISKENHDILDKIAKDLASLKDEINGLKTEFEDLKNNSSVPANISTKQQEKEEGFFAGNDEDETIALSGDELNNILNNADFTTPKSVSDDDLNEQKEAVEPESVEAEAVEPEELKEETITDNISENKTEPAADEEKHDSESPLGSLDSSLEIPDQDDYESDNGLKMDFSNEKLEEPVFDNLDLGNSIEPETHEEDISIPKVDDILVESSNSDLMDSNITSENDNSKAEEPVASDVEETEPLPLENEQTSTDNFEEPKVEEPSDNLNNDSISKPINLFKEEEPADITDDNLNYLSEEPKEETPSMKEQELQEDNSSTEDTEPVDSVFDQWGKPSEDNSFEESKAVEQQEEQIEDKEEPADELKAEEIETTKPVVNNTTSSDSNTIPSDMKQEIKSVLSYMDQLLENLPEDKITEFAQSKQFETYKKLFSELGLA
ncbi:MAG: hypothetical protein WCQ67_00505 [Treponema sp.]